MRLFLTLLTLLNAAVAHPVALMWDPSPESENVTEYRLYRHTVVGNAFIASVPNNTIRVDLEDGDTVYVTSYNGKESMPSAMLQVNFVTLTLQASYNLKDWEVVQTMPIATGRVEKRFFRLKIER